MATVPEHPWEKGALCPGGGRRGPFRRPAGRPLGLHKRGSAAVAPARDAAEALILRHAPVRGRGSAEPSAPLVPVVELLEAAQSGLRPAGIAKMRRGRSAGLRRTTGGEGAEGRILLPEELLRKEPGPPVDGSLFPRNQRQVETSKGLCSPTGRQSIPGPSHGPSPRDSGAMVPDAGTELHILPHGRCGAGDRARSEGAGKLALDVPREVLWVVGERSAQGKPGGGAAP